MRYHIIAFFGGFLLDLILGDPNSFPHPVRLIGRLVAGLEKKLYEEKTEEKAEEGIEEKTKEKAKEKIEAKEKTCIKLNKAVSQFWHGVVLVVIVLVCVVAAAAVLLLVAYHINPYIGMAAECIMTYQVLAIKCLRVESMKVYKALKADNLKQAREAVSMIVGRDTQCLNEEGVAKAAIETIAENTSDGVIAPMIYLAAGGPVLGFLYKAVNTMDSMIGYKNDKYLYFGRAAAKLDDFVNFLPSRIAAGLMIAAAFLAGKDFSGRRAFTIYKRDRKKHASPNSGQTEAVCAGALGIKLAGDAGYFGKIVKKPYIGDAFRSVEYEDIKRANRLMYVTAVLCEAACLLGMGVKIN